MMLSVSARIVLMTIAQIAIGIWVFLAASEQSASKPGLDARAIRGQTVWRASGCSSCHALFGLGGHMGPDLTNVIERRGSSYVQSVIKHGVGPMPPASFAETDVDAVTEYLRSLDRLAVYPIPSYREDVFGRFKPTLGERARIP